LAAIRGASLGDVVVQARARKFRMKKPPANPTEQKCPACDDTGFPAAKQPAQPGRMVVGCVYMFMA